MPEAQPLPDRRNWIPRQVCRLLWIAGVKHVDLYAGRNLKPPTPLHRRKVHFYFPSAEAPLQTGQVETDESQADPGGPDAY